MKITVLGEGSWGTAIANLLANNGYNIKLWCYSSEVSKEIKLTRKNTCYLKNIKLNNKIYATSSLKDALENSNLIIEAIPVKFLRSVILESKKYLNSSADWLILSKGIETETLLFPTQIIKNIISKNINFAVLSGPSFAVDVSKQSLTVVNLASNNSQLSINLKKIFDNSFFKIKIIDDIIGIQVFGAVKNIIALAMGMLDGLEYGDNTKAFLFTQGLHEMRVLSNALGAQSNTIFDLSGFGDLVLTSFSSKSKNFSLGKSIALSRKSDKELLGSTVESLNTVNSVYQLMQKHNLELQLFSNIYNIINNNKSIDFLFHNLII